MSWDVAADAGVLCDEAVELSETIQGASATSFLLTLLLDFTGICARFMKLLLMTSSEGSQCGGHIGIFIQHLQSRGF